MMILPKGEGSSEMKTGRPTIPDLAREAEVSVATVNRILSGSKNVRSSTIQRVQEAAERIGFYALGTIEDRIRRNIPRRRLGFLLQQSSRDLYRHLAAEIVKACRGRRSDIIEPVVEFVDDLTPENISTHLRKLGESCDAVAIIAADHPLIGQTIHELHEAGTPVVTYITDQSAPDRAAYVGVDNWKIGRTAAYLMTEMIHGTGRIAVFLGNHRYQCQDISDASFRTYVREHAPDILVEESRLTLEEADRAYGIVRDLIATTEDLVGIFMIGGGISGILRALRETPIDQRKAIKLISRDIGPATRMGLNEALITAALCHPIEAISSALVQTMVDAITGKIEGKAIQVTLPFDIITPVNT